MQNRENEENPQRRTAGLAGTTRTIAGKRNFSQPPGIVNDRFLDLLERHVFHLTVHGRKASGLCPLHPDRHPSFTADLEKLVWFCFPCARGGGVKDFALAVGEPWGTTHYSTREHARFAVLARRREAEAKAKAILTQRKDQHDTVLWAAWGEATTAAFAAAELLGLFFRRPDLAEAFPALVEVTEQEYSDALFQKMLTEQRYAGEVES